MVNFFLSLNPIIQLSWLPIIGFFVYLAGYGIVTTAATIIRNAVQIAREERHERFDSSWMSLEKYIGLK